MGSSVLITGGVYNPKNRVTEYNEDGWVKEFPQLLKERYYHGCSYYDNNDGTKVDIN